MDNIVTIPDKLVEKMVDWENPPTVRDLKHDYDESYTTFSEQVRKIDQWLSSYNAELKVKIPKGNSRVQTKLIRKQAEWRYPSLTEPFLSNDTLFEIQPATHMDKEGAYFNKLILNSQFNKDIDRVAFIDEYVRTCVDEGTVIVKVGWETVEEEVEEIEEQTIYATPEEAMLFLQDKVQSGEMSEEEAQAYLQSGKPVIKEKKESIRKRVVEKINRPSLEICDYRDVIIDPSCRGDLSKANFIIHRFTTDMSTLKKDGRYSNLDMIRADDHSPLSDPDYSDNVDTFSFKDKPRKKFVCYEYWGYWDINNTGIVEPIIATYVGDIMIRLDKNPYPFNKLPFVVVPYMPVRRSVYGESDSALLEDNQNIISAVFRGMIDLLGKSANGQTGISKDALDAVNYEKYKNGQDFKFNPNINPDHAFHMFKYPEIPRSALEIVQMLQMESEALVGKKAFSEGISGTSLGNSVGGIRSALDASNKREMGILRRLSQGLIEIARMVISMNAVWLSDEEIIRLTDEEFITIPRSSLAGKYDLELSISTPEVDNMQSQKLAFMLQTLGNKVPFSFTKILLADIARLDKRHKLAKMIEEYEEQPDPIAQKMAELELAMKEAQIRNEMAKGAENEVDVQLKSWKAEYEKARARNLEADSDMKDLDFVRKGQGIEHQEQMDKEMLKEENKANIAVLNSMNANKNDRRTNE
jgi:hypothetical protein